MRAWIAGKGDGWLCLGSFYLELCSLPRQPGCLPIPSGKPTLGGKATPIVDEKCKAANKKLAALWLKLSALVLVEQHAFGFCRIHWTIEELVAVAVDLDEGRAHGEGALDERLRERVFDVFLQRAP